MANPVRDKALFDALRARLADLEGWTGGQTIAEHMPAGIDQAHGGMPSPA